jgi:hypothetical protein
MAGSLIGIQNLEFTHDARISKKKIRKKNRRTEFPLKKYFFKPQIQR